MWDVIPYIVVSRYQCCQETCCLDHHCSRVCQTTKIWCRYREGRTRTKSLHTFIANSDPVKEYFQRTNTEVRVLQDPSTTLLPIYQLQSVTFRKTTVLIFISMKTSNGDIPTWSLLAPFSFHYLSFNSSSCFQNLLYLSEIKSLLLWPSSPSYTTTIHVAANKYTSFLVMLMNLCVSRQI